MLLRGRGVCPREVHPTPKKEQSRVKQEKRFDPRRRRGQRGGMKGLLFRQKKGKWVVHEKLRPKGTGENEEGQKEKRTVKKE